MKKSNTQKIIIFVALILLIIASIYFLSLSMRPETISYDDFLDKVKAGEIKRIYVSSYSVKVLYTTSTNDSRFPKKADAELNIAYRTQLEERLEAIDAEAREDSSLYPDYVQPRIDYDDPTDGSYLPTLITILGVILLGVLMFYMFKASQGANSKAMNFGKTKARISQNLKVRFSDVAGADEEKEELREIVDFLKSTDKFQAVGARIPKGVLLVGSPGTGKTLFAKAVAGEAGVPFFSISGSDFVEMFVGVGASRVRDLFDQAKRSKPCIIFIDEIDAVGRQRGAGLGGGHDEREQTLNQLLVQMDGFETNEGIIVMAATNRADILDPALLRPGRFDRQIYVQVPDVKGREAIFKIHSRNKPLAGDINFKQLARMTSGFTGADIENLLNEAAILAARNSRSVILMTDIYEGINKVIMGPQKKSRIVTETDKRITAYHESGHAIIAKLLPHCDEVQEVSIIPRGMAAGYTLTRPETDDSHVTKNKLQDMICMMLGGRAAEEIVIKDISTGASNDIQRATGVAKNMIVEWGMSEELGNSFWGTEHEVFLGRDYGAQHSYSEEIASKIDKGITEIIDCNYQRALDLLNEHRNVLENMVKLLYARETIYSDEVEMLFNGETVEAVLAYIASKESKNIKGNMSNIIVDEKKFAAQSEVDKATESETAKFEANATDKTSGEQAEKSDTSENSVEKSSDDSVKNSDKSENTDKLDK